MAALSEVMSTDIVTVAPTATVAEAATVMATNHVGAAIVMDGEALAGIFTERDVMRAVASDFDAAGHLVGQWMTPRPVTLTPDAPPGEALDLMLERGFRHLPVVDAGKVVGVVSIRDLTPRSAG
jgi:CBS domain-containing protein